MSEFTPGFQPEQIYEPLEGYTAEETLRMYPFGYFVFPDGQIFGRDPLQEANAGIDVPQQEIDLAMKLMIDEAFGEDVNPENQEPYARWVNIIFND